MWRRRWCNLWRGWSLLSPVSGRCFCCVVFHSFCLYIFVSLVRFGESHGNKKYVASVSLRSGVCLCHLSCVSEIMSAVRVSLLCRRFICVHLLMLTYYGRCVCYSERCVRDCNMGASYQSLSRLWLPPSCLVRIWVLNWSQAGVSPDYCILYWSSALRMSHKYFVFD